MEEVKMTVDKMEEILAKEAFLGGYLIPRLTLE